MQHFVLLERRSRDDRDTHDKYFWELTASANLINTLNSDTKYYKIKGYTNRCSSSTG